MKSRILGRGVKERPHPFLNERGGVALIEDPPECLPQLRSDHVGHELLQAYGLFEPDLVSEHTDHFGNRSSYVEVRSPHRVLDRIGHVRRVDRRAFTRAGQCSGASDPASRSRDQNPLPRESACCVFHSVPIYGQDVPMSILFKAVMGAEAQLPCPHLETLRRKDRH